jgi:hypothetical protein
MKRSTTTHIAYIRLQPRLFALVVKDALVVVIFKCLQAAVQQRDSICLRFKI